MEQGCLIMNPRELTYGAIVSACLIPDLVWAHGGYEGIFLGPFILTLVSVVLFQTLMVGLGMYKRYFRYDWAIVVTMLLSGMILILLIVILGALDIKNLGLIVKVPFFVIPIIALANFILPLWQRNRSHLEKYCT